LSAAAAAAAATAAAVLTQAPHQPALRCFCSLAPTASEWKPQ
jgi:hypothetical protein